MRAVAACPVQAILVEGLADRADQPPRGGGPWTVDGPSRFKRHGRIVIVGASLAGLRAAETLRRRVSRGR